jgi:excisionase family DNA binding protein
MDMVASPEGNEHERAHEDYGLTQPLYTIAEAADVLRINRATIYRHAKAGRLRLTKIGLRTVIRKADIEALIERGGLN